MKTLQTGTKVLIEATVIKHKNKDIATVQTDNAIYTVHPSDLTVCETAQPIDLQNFAIDITDPVNAELLPGFKEWFMKDYKTQTSFNYQYYEVLNGSKNRTNHYDTPHYLTTLPELQKQHPGVFGSETQQIEVGDMVTTKSFTNGDGFYVDDRQIKYFGREGTAVYVTEKLCQVNHGKGEPFYIWPLSAVELVHKKLEPVPTPSFKAGQEVPKHGDKIHALKVSEWVDAIYCCPHPNQTSALKHIVTDVDSIITWSTSAIRPIPAQPTVESELRQLYEKAKAIDRYETWKSLATAWHQKHSGRVEVSESEIDEPINNAYKEAQKYSNKTFPLDSMQKDKIHFNAGVEHMKRYVKHEFTSHFMTRKEANQ